MAIRERDVNRKASTESAYFISSLENHAPTIAKPVREHWGIENGLHWAWTYLFAKTTAGYATAMLLRISSDSAAIFSSFAKNLKIAYQFLTSHLSRKSS
jgi:predicted transposase YbfD/YdcC